jgi:hypothetical protein
MKQIRLRVSDQYIRPTKRNDEANAPKPDGVDEELGYCLIACEGGWRQG